MKLKIKQKHLDKALWDPFTKQSIHLRFLPESKYEFYYNKGFDHLFEIIEDEIGSGGQIKYSYKKFPKENDSDRNNNID